MKRRATVFWVIALGLLAPGRGAVNAPSPSLACEERLAAPPQAVNSPQRSPSIALERLNPPDIEASLIKCPPKNSDRFQLIEKMFRDAGCPDEHMRTQRVKGSQEPNLICAFPGKSENVIIVGAHFDCSPEGLGLIDNWSGVAISVFLAYLDMKLK